MIAVAQDLIRQCSSREGRAAWAADLRAVPALLRWALPWALLGGSSVDANPCRWLVRFARERPELAFLSTGKGEYSFGWVAAQTARARAGLARGNVTAGRRVAILERDPVMQVVGLLACWAVGAEPCVLDADGAKSWVTEQLRRLAPYGLWGDGASGFEGTVEGARALGWSEPQSSLRRWPRIAAKSTGVVLPTSGSEGAPKLCKVSLGRLVLGGHAFGGALMGLRPGDIIYCPLPLSHATGLIAGLMAALIHGRTLHLPRGFSASRFCEDLERSGGTHLVYVGDLLRYVMASVTREPPISTRLRVMLGNGLDRETFESVKRGFPRTRVLEFYGATELSALIVNFSERPGAVGRVPFRRCSRFEVVESASLDSDGVRRVAPGEVGELAVRLPKPWWPTVGAFEGYVESEHERMALRAALLNRNATYYLTGDRVRYDENDYFYFVERSGNVWRRKGHNVSTLWLKDEIRRCQGVVDCDVHLVSLDDSAQRFAVLRIVAEPNLELTTLSKHVEGLPAHARPQFVCFVSELPRGATFKPARPTGPGEAFEPSRLGEAVYLWDRGLQAYCPKSWQRYRAHLLAAVSTALASHSDGECPQ